MFPTRPLAIAALAAFVGCSGGGSSPGAGPPLPPTAAPIAATPPPPSSTATPTTVTATAVPTNTTATPSPTPTPAQTATPTQAPAPAPQVLTVSPASLSFTSAAAQMFKATETGYGGAFNASSVAPTSCTGIATFSPATANGPTASIAVTPVAAGMCTIVVTDTIGQRATVSISVTTTTGTISSVGRSR